MDAGSGVGPSDALGIECLGRAWPPPEVLGWTVLTASVLGVLLLLLRRNLLQNHRPGDDSLLAGLGPANTITLARGLAVAALAGFLAAPLPMTGALAWAPAILYAAAVLPDFLDGAVARATNRVTVLGGILDMETDCLGMLAVSLLAVRLGKAPWWYVSLGLARYLFVAGIWWRRAPSPAGPRPDAQQHPPVGGRVPDGLLLRRVVAHLRIAHDHGAGHALRRADPARLRPRRPDRQRDGQPALTGISPIRALARLDGSVAAARAAVDRRVGSGGVPAAGAASGAARSGLCRCLRQSRSRWGSARAWELSACSWRRWRAWRWSASGPMTPC